jgi:DnaJ-class molecular chaperone
MLYMPMLYKSLYDNPPSAEPRRTAPVAVPTDFLTVRPSMEELLAHISQNFFNPRKSGGPYRKLGVDAFIQPEDARFGCHIPLGIQSYVRCDECLGTGCSSCHGYGVTQRARRTLVEIPPGARDGQRYEVNLGPAGIRNLMMEVRIIFH